MALFVRREALEAIHGVLARIEAQVAGADLGALKHLAPIRVAVRNLADGQDELVGIIEQVAAGAPATDADDDDDAEAVEDDDDSDDDSSLAREMADPPVVPFRPRPGAVVIDVDSEGVDDDDPKEGA